MKTKQILTLLLFTVLILSSFTTAYAQSVRDRLTDRCSGDVIIVANYDDPLDASDALYLSRDQDSDGDGYTNWQYIPTNSRRVRWYCHSESWGRYLDPGTWRITGVGIEIQCDEGGENCHPNPTVEVGFSDIDGWFPERSRCSRGAVQWARLGPDRLLQMLCM